MPVFKVGRDVNQPAPFLVEQVLGLLLECGAVGADPEAVGPIARARDACPPAMTVFDVAVHPDQPSSLLVEQVLRCFLKAACWLTGS